MYFTILPKVYLSPSDFPKAGSIFSSNCKEEKTLAVNAMKKACKMSSKLVLVFVLIFFSKSSMVTSQDCSAIDEDETNVTTCIRRKNTNKVLKIAVLLPSETTETDPHNLVYHNRLEKVQMALETIADVNNTHQTQYISPLKQVLPGWKIEVVTGDTECSATAGPLEAFRWHCQAGLMPPKHPLSHTFTILHNLCTISNVNVFPSDNKRGEVMKIRKTNEGLSLFCGFFFCGNHLV